MLRFLQMWNVKRVKLVKIRVGGSRVRGSELCRALVRLRIVPWPGQHDTSSQAKCTIILRWELVSATVELFPTYTVSCHDASTDGSLPSVTLPNHTISEPFHDGHLIPFTVSRTPENIFRCRIQKLSTFSHFLSWSFCLVSILLAGFTSDLGNFYPDGGYVNLFRHLERLAQLGVAPSDGFSPARGPLRVSWFLTLTHDQKSSDDSASCPSRHFNVYQTRPVRSYVVPAVVSLNNLCVRVAMVSNNWATCYPFGVDSAGRCWNGVLIVVVEHQASGPRPNVPMESKLAMCQLTLCCRMNLHWVVSVSWSMPLVRQQSESWSKWIDVRWDCSREKSQMGFKDQSLPQHMQKAHKISSQFVNEDDMEELSVV